MSGRAGKPVRPWLPVMVALVCVVATTAVVWSVSAPRPACSSAAALSDDGNPGRGCDVFAAGDCSSCHASPGQDDRLRLGGGLALATPFGTMRSPNISPDPTDGP